MHIRGNKQHFSEYAFKNNIDSKWDLKSLGILLLLRMIDKLAIVLAPTCNRPWPHRFTFTWWGCCGLCLWHKPTELVHSFLFCSCVSFCLHGPFNCISFYKLSRQLSAFSLFSCFLISALLVLSTICLFVKVSLGPDYNPLWFTGLKAAAN